MKEAQKGQIVILKTPLFEVETIVDRAEPDRLKLNYTRAVSLLVQKLTEGEEVIASVHTSAGVKRMRSMVMTNTQKELVIENAPAIQEVQNREFVRAQTKVRIFIKFKGRLTGATTLDLSGGGVKFQLDRDDETLCATDIFSIRFQEDDFQIPMLIKAQVIKTFDANTYVANFLEITEQERDAIVRFCIKALS